MTGAEERGVGVDVTVKMIKKVDTETELRGWGDAWRNGKHICFPSLQPMLEYWFESRLGLESSGVGMWHFLRLVARAFLRVLQFPPLLHWLMVQPIE